MMFFVYKRACLREFWVRTCNLTLSNKQKEQVEEGEGGWSIIKIAHVSVRPPGNLKVVLYCENKINKLSEGTNRIVKKSVWIESSLSLFIVFVCRSVSELRGEIWRFDGLCFLEPSALVSNLALGCCLHYNSTCYISVSLGSTLGGRQWEEDYSRWGSRILISNWYTILYTTRSSNWLSLALSLQSLLSLSAVSVDHATNYSQSWGGIPLRQTSEWRHTPYCETDRFVSLLSLLICRNGIPPLQPSQL